MHGLELVIMHDKRLEHHAFVHIEHGEHHVEMDEGFRLVRQLLHDHVTFSPVFLGQAAHVLDKGVYSVSARPASVAYDKYVTSSDLAEMKGLEEAVKDADYISMHLPFTPETDKMLSSSLIEKMEKKPVIINTGRGKCVDEQAVAAALKEGKIAWFCTDVYSSEPPSADNPLMGCEHVTFTPHVGANTTENLLRIGEEVVETIAKYKEEGRI